jgi:glycosyltransferase involved in cell wall biosynthesis
MWIKRRYHIPYIFEVGDLWPDAPIQMGFVENHFFIKFLYSLERTIYKNAESIVALSSMIQEGIQKKVEGKIIHLIPNMADTEYYRPQPKKHELIQKFGLQGKFVVSYTGAVGVANGLDYFLDCARASQKAGLPIHFLLCGEGAMLAGLKASAKRLMLTNFSFLDFQNREGVRDVINVSDAVFVCYKHVPILETGSPNKYFDGLAAGKLIVINFGGWIRREIEEAQCGIFSNPQQPTDFVKKIQPFISNLELRATYQQAARQLAERKYARVLLSEKFSSIFKNSLT